MLIAVSESGRVLLAALGIGSLVVGFAAVGALAWFVIRRAPPDGSDVGRDPRLEQEEQPRKLS